MSIDVPRRIQTEIDRTDMHAEHGVYHFADDNITVISQPDFATTLDAIAEQSSSDTTIITPELALLDDTEFADFSKEMQQRPEIVRLLSERFMQLKEVSVGSNNTIMMGAPIRAVNTSGYNNGMVGVKNGQLVHEQRKVHAGMYEAGLGWFEYKDAPNRYHRLGRTALICSELIFALNMSPYEKQRTDTILLPAAWGVPSLTPKAIEKHGGVDAYNAYTLTTATRMAAEDLPNLKRVYVADRAIGGNRPQVGRMKVERD